MFDEMEAAARWGISPAEYWLLEREDRKVMVAYCRLERVRHMMDEYDSLPPERRR